MPPIIKVKSQEAKNEEDIPEDPSSKPEPGASPNHGITKDLESQRSRHLIDKLRKHGLGKYVELPQVAIMGDTSSGKSSVLSALSGISFPSSEKLTTRCPTQLIMKYADRFSGSVTLQRHKPNPDEKITPTIIKSMKGITKQIQKLTQQLVNENQEISDDSIVIQICGPELPNLTLIDLPGLVRAVESKEDKSIIPRVRALVNRYLQQSRTIILAVVPGNVDVHNTEILEMAKEVDPDGNRTQAIITKLDLIDLGAEQEVIELLHNRRTYLKLGYHAVKSRGQKDLNDGVSIAEGIMKETLFFRESPIWSNVPQSLIGINQLRFKLVRLLEDIIIRELPSVISEIETRERKCEEELAKLGPPMDTKYNRRGYYSKIVETYNSIMEAALKGNYNASDFFQENGNKDKDNRFRALVRIKEEFFRGKILKMQHNVGYVRKHKVYRGDMVRVKSKICRFGELQLEEGDEDEDEDEELEEVTSGTVVMVVYSPLKPNQSIVNVLKPDGTTVQYGTDLYEFHVRALDKIKELIKVNRGEELPIFPSYTIFCSIVQTYIGSWEKPVMDLFNYYKSTLSKVSERAILHCNCKPKISRHIGTTISAIMTHLEKQITEKLKQKLLTERKPYTLNHYLFDIIIKLRTKPLLDALDKFNGKDVPVETVRALLASHGVGQSDNEDHVAIETENAIIAYLKVAAKRFIDEIPILINESLQDSFLNVIKERLSVIDDEELSRLLAEDPATLQKRKDLMEEQESLAASRRDISDLDFSQ